MRYNVTMAKSDLTREDTLHLASLASLKLSDEETEKYTSQITETLEYVKNLEELPTDTVEGTNQTIKLENVTFDDGVRNTKGLSSEEATKNGKTKNGYFVVKKIL
jgi:aspartyl-tRNA(Asn)/glutamyl-tRNA(Gln) amidotransferase subunit C